jgi:hypothetical protein
MPLWDRFAVFAIGIYPMSAKRKPRMRFQPRLGMFPFGRASSLIRLQCESRSTDLEAYTSSLTGLDSARSARPGDYLRG